MHVASEFVPFVSMKQTAPRGGTRSQKQGLKTPGFPASFGGSRTVFRNKRTTPQKVLPLVLRVYGAEGSPKKLGSHQTLSLLLTSLQSLSSLPSSLLSPSTPIPPYLPPLPFFPPLSCPDSMLSFATLPPWSTKRRELVFTSEFPLSYLCSHSNWLIVQIFSPIFGVKRGEPVEWCSHCKHTCTNFVFSQSTANFTTRPSSPSWKFGAKFLTWFGWVIYFGSFWRFVQSRSYTFWASKNKQASEEIPLPFWLKAVSVQGTCNCQVSGTLLRG